MNETSNINSFPPEAVKACPLNREMFWGSDDRNDQEGDKSIWCWLNESWNEANNGYVGNLTNRLYSRPIPSATPTIIATSFPTSSTFTDYLAKFLGRGMSAGAAIDETTKAMNRDFAKAHMALIREHVERLMIEPLTMEAK